jgi:hypothetical protein
MSIIMNLVQAAIIGGLIYLWWQNKLPKSPKA